MAKLIIIEGLDGCGKSTQTELIEKYFNNQNISYRKIKLPDYDSKSSELVKMYLNGDFGSSADDVNAYAAGAFYAVDRFASYMLEWKKDYENKDIILADRYATSNSIYQMEKIDEVDWDKYLEWSADFEYEKIGIPKPDLVIYLDMPIEISQKLMTSRYNGDEEKKDVHEADVEFLQKCRKSALYTAKKQGWAVIPCSDGESPLPIDEIHNTIIDFIKREIK
ncbi:MAG: deoxynucleoside kinase [Acetobacter sp.]|nr:deoxynucleoside kinase [Bacteroides sp.]MCM1340505.1 deoxynucleoside kinase [Acetobacter sp.]MCM1433245.1 deoxynucleoside kinase [Clostridiales bacterium]